MAIEVGLGQTALNDTATVDFTSSELSAAPKVIFALAGDGASNGTEDADIRIGFGCTDGTDQYAGVGRVNDNTGLVEVQRRTRNNAALLRDTTLSTEDRLEHNSFLSNGWRADHTNRSNFGKLALAAMFGGSDVTAEAGTFTINNGTVTLRNSSLTPNVLIFFTQCNDANGSTSGFFVPCFGIALDEGASIKQRSITAAEENSSSYGDMKMHIDTANALQQHSHNSLSRDWTASVSGMAQGEFTISTGGTGGDEGGYIALQIDNANLALIDLDSPTTNGLHEVTSPGFQPKFVMQALSMMTTLDTSVQDPESSAFALSLFNASEAYCYSWADEDGATTIDCQSMCHNRPVYMDADDGTLAFDATFSQFTSNGWELDYSTVDGTARKGFALAIGEVSSGISGTADQTLSAITQALSGDLAFSGNATQIINSITQDASGSTTDVLTGSITQTLGVINQSLSGALTYGGTVDQTLASITQSASGNLTFLGTVEQTLAAITQDASGEIVAPGGDIAQTLAALTQSMSGELSYSATSTQTLPAIVQSAQQSVADKVLELDFQKRGHFARGSLRRK